MTDSPPDATEILQAVTRGDERAADRLLPLVYDELRRLAGRLMADEPAGQTLQPTALVHEAYLRLVDQDRAQVSDRTHFAAVASIMLRRVLVDHARRRNRQKRGGGRQRESLARLESNEAGVADFVELDDALTTLAEDEPRAARVVEMRYFGGLTIEQTAAALDVSTPTVERDWRYARAWLHERLSA